MPRQHGTKSQYYHVLWWPHWRWALAAIAMLCLLGVCVSRIARSPLDTDEVAGSYAPSVPWTLHGTAAFPEAVTMDANGWLTMRTSLGTEQRNRWWWDGDEGWVRCELPELDHRIRGYRGWWGPVLYFRCAEPLNRPEEVRLQRLD